MGDMAKILYHGYYFSFTWGVVSAGKRAICDRMHLLKIVKACNRSLMHAVFLHLHLHLVIWQTLLSKATYNWGIHKAIHLEEAIRQRKCS